MNGKWILKDLHPGDNQKGYPGFQLLEINSSTAYFYTDFSLKTAPPLQVLEEELRTSTNRIFASYKVVDKNHLKLFIDGRANDKKAVFECDFCRLIPTITSLTKEDIEQMIFILVQNGSKSELTFNKELWSTEDLKLFKREEGEENRIEQIDSTLFVSFKSNGKRVGYLPIKEVTTEFLKLYAIPTIATELIAYRKK